ncbi:MAG TPA: hypothetical protein VF743_04285, partial [Acidimicrobiales bacterium]
MADVAVGCVVGTGWVVVVGLAAADDGEGDAGGLTVVVRERVDLVDGPGRFAYHVAADQPLPLAERTVAAAGRAAATAAAGAV